MDANKFGCFVAERRKELNMTQKELATKIQVTDKAVSKWERGLGFPDINTIESLADALEVSIIELMKSEKTMQEVTMKEGTTEAISAVSDVIDMAKMEAQRKDRTLFIALILTSFLCALFEMVANFSVVHEAELLSMSMVIPATAVVPGAVMVLWSLIRIIKGEKIWNYFWAGLSMSVIPYVLMGGVFLFYELFIY